MQKVAISGQNYRLKPFQHHACNSLAARQLHVSWEIVSEKTTDFSHLNSVLAKEFVVENGRGQADGLRLVVDFLGANNSPLAENTTILLPRDFLRHLEDHFDQRVVGQMLRPMEEHTGLT